MDVLLPHRDFTQASDSQAQALDLGRAFVERVMAERALEAQARKLRAAGAMKELLALEAGRTLLHRKGAHEHTALRGLGAILSSLSEGDSGVRLQVDDLHLPASGTTERSADVLTAAQEATPFDEELDRAAEQLASDDESRVWLERDQELLALARLSTRLRRPLRVDGPFAHAHREALRRWPGIELAAKPSPPRPRRVSPLTVTGEGLAWGRTVGNAWGGEVPFHALSQPGALVESGCQVAVVGFCELGESVLGADGARLALADVERALQTLSDAGVKVWAEWFVGAPGVSAQRHERTYELLRTTHAFPRLAGVRTFHWSAQAQAARFGSVWVEPLPLPADRELARSRAFMAAESLNDTERNAAVEHYARALRAFRPGVPGRIASAYSCAGAPSAKGEALRLDPDSAVVELPASLEGASRTSWYAVNLRLGVTLAVDARIGPKLAGLERPSRQALVELPAPIREKLLRALLEKQLLVEAPE